MGKKAGRMEEDKNRVKWEESVTGVRWASVAAISLPSSGHQESHHSDLIYHDSAPNRQDPYLPGSDYNNHDSRHSNPLLAIAELNWTRYVHKHFSSDTMHELQRYYFESM